VQNKDVLGYLDGLLRARLADDPIWNRLAGVQGKGEMLYRLPADVLFSDGKLTQPGHIAAIRLATVLRNWDNVVTLRVTAVPGPAVAPLMDQATALEQALVENGMTVLKQAEWRLPANETAPAELDMVVQGAK
jgi:hypothetical protein